MTHSVDVARAATWLARGGLVAFPTETVYGLGADASQPQAVAKIFAVKGRPTSHPLIVHLATVEGLVRWARMIPPFAQRLADRFYVIAEGRVVEAIDQDALARDTARVEALLGV